MAEHSTLRDLWLSRVASRADAEFLVFEDPDTGCVERYTYAQFGKQVACAEKTLAGLGVGKGDRVAVQMCNRVEFVECFLALACMGAVLVPLNSSLTPAECRHIIGQCGIKLLITENLAGDRAGSGDCSDDDADGGGADGNGGDRGPAGDENGGSVSGDSDFDCGGKALSQSGSGAVPLEERSELAALGCQVLPLASYQRLRLGQAAEATKQTEPVARDEAPSNQAPSSQAPSSQASTDLPQTALAPSDLAEIMYTSGTTSAPKGVMITHANMTFSGSYVAWELDMRPEDRYLTCMAVTHVNFQLSALVPAIQAGCTLVLLRRYSARAMWRQVREHKASLVQAMAMIVRTLLKQPVAPGEADHSVREVHYFLPLSQDEKQAFESRFGVRLLNNYGSTETLVGSITDYPEGPRRWPSIGRAGPGYQVRILGSDGAPAPAGTCGQIQIRGQQGVSLMAGYWKDPGATASAIDAQGWYSTGDAGYVDEHGWVYFTDRLGDLIKRAGENISAAEIEQVLLAHPDVADVAVFGVPDEVRDEAVKAVVVPAAGTAPSKAGLRSFAAQRLACFKIPEIIEFRASLPRSQYGKINRNRLRERHRNGYQD